MFNEIGWYIALAVIFATVWVVDMFFINKKAHVMSMKEAISWSVFYVALSLAFGEIIFLGEGYAAARDFIAAYVVEKSLSVDNLFVFLMIFSFFAVPRAYQHRLLSWGILGAIVIRTIIIVAGTNLAARFDWILYVFALLLLYSVYKMFTSGDEPEDFKENKLYKLTQKVFPLTRDYEGAKFFVRKAGKLFATPLFLVLVVIESSDLMFATDSLPAVMAISQHTFVVLASNIFAIMGLRALYFVVENLIGKLEYLKYGLTFVLSFIALKLLLPIIGIHVPTDLSLLIVLGTIILTTIISLVFPPKKEVK